MPYKTLQIVAGYLLMCLSVATFAAVSLQPVTIDLQDKAKLQRGAMLYMNYCSGCHALRYLRYDRMAKDLGLTTFDGDVDKDLLYSNLVFTKAAIHDPIRISMPAQEAAQWFGLTPPDLSLTAREKGASWLYTYLKSFYADSTRPFGANNLLKPDVAMPNVLEPLAGWVIAVDEQNKPGLSRNTGLLQIKKGELSAEEFDKALQDLVNFLVYVAEPAKLVRYRLGVPVLLFLSLFLVLAYGLKQTYWRRLPK